MHRLIHLPVLSVNEDAARVYWEAEDRAAVRRGQTIAAAENSKVTVEIASEAAGTLYRLVGDGDLVGNGRPIALVDERADLTQADIRALVAPATTPAAAGTGTASPPSSPPDRGGDRRRWTRKAELLAKAKGVAPDEDVPSAAGDVVTEADVRAYIEQGRQGPAARPPPPGATAAAAVADTVDDLYPDGRRQRVLVLGGGRGAVQVLDVLFRLGGRLRPIGIVDDDAGLHGKAVMGVPVLGGTGAAPDLWREGRFDGAIVSMSNAREYRRRLFEELSALGVPFPNVIDPTTVVHSNVKLGQGNVVMAHCRIGSCTRVGDNNFLSAYVNLEHHNRLGSHCLFGPAVSTSSRVAIGDYVKLGTGIFMEPGVTVGDNAVVGSGAVLVGAVPADSLVRVKVNYAVTPLAAEKDEA